MLIKRRIETAVAIVLLLGCGFLLLFRATGGGVGWGDLAEKLAFATLVALGVRWLGIWFGEIPETQDIFESTGNQIRDAIQKATDRIWIHQTWLPAVGGDARLILDSRVTDIRLLLLSYREESPIFARIKLRFDLPSDAAPGDRVEVAKSNSAMSALPFKAAGKQDSVRFTRYHHPGWIAVIDDEVFWGLTPLDADNWSIPEVCYRARRTQKRASYMVRQFKLLWDGTDPLTEERLSHTHDEEMRYNPRL